MTDPTGRETLPRRFKTLLGNTSPRPSRRRARLPAVLAGLGALTLFAVLALPSLLSDPPSPLMVQRAPGIDATVTSAVATRFSLCGGGKRDNCVVDGDTFWLGGEKIRLEDIDTPELSPPRCERERALGEAARGALLAMLNAGPFEIGVEGRRATDRYGRALRTVSRDGRSIGETLVAKGLARRYDGARRGWCD